MKFKFEIESDGTNPYEIAAKLTELAHDIKRNGLQAVEEFGVLRNITGTVIGRWGVTTEPDALEALVLLRDIYNHIEEGGALYPGSLIFEEDAPAVAVLGNFLRNAGLINARP
jgi:hypothetical protein